MRSSLFISICTRARAWFRAWASEERLPRLRNRKALAPFIIVFLTLGLGTTPALATNGKHWWGHDNDATKDVSLLWFIGGTHDLFECDVPPTAQGTTTASCHEHELLDLRTGRVIGYAIDGSSDVGSDGSAVWATGTTTFHITKGRYRGSVLQVRGTGTIQPTVIGDPHFEWTNKRIEYDNTPITHIAGIFPDPGENQVLESTGRLAGSEGTFALFGGLNLSNPDSATFNCIFKIDLKVPRRSLRRPRYRHY